MSPRTLILIIILTIVTAGLVYVAITPKQEQPAPTPIAAKPTPTPAAQTTLALTPNPIVVSSQSGTLEVAIDTGKNNVTAVQLELSYDPKVLQNITITTPKTNGFFTDPVTLLKEIDAKNGTVSYALGINPTDPPKKGKGILAKLAFQAVRGASGQATQVSFSPKTLVTAEGINESVLKSSSGATIILSPLQQIPVTQ